MTIYAKSTPTINMNPAIQELCALEGTCNNSVPVNSSGFGPRSFTAFSPPYSNSMTVTEHINSSLAFTELLPKHYDLLTKIEGILNSHDVPQKYKDELIEPFYAYLINEDEEGFEDVVGDPRIKHIAHAILQNFGPNNPQELPKKNTEALREVISDLYQQFLHSTCEHAPHNFCKKIASPVPHWYEGDLSTYPNLKDFEIKVSLVNVPSRYAKKSTLAWGCLGHEVTGHDILAAYPGAREELERKIQKALADNNLTNQSSYWVNCLEETTSDILGVLNMGPAAAFSLIGFLRALSSRSSFKLESEGWFNDPHPAALLRGFIVAYTVRLMDKKKFTQAPNYATTLLEEVNKDAQDVAEILFDSIPLGTTESLLSALKQLRPGTAESLRSREFTTYGLRESVVKTCIGILNSRKKDQFLKFLSVPQQKELLHLREIDALNPVGKVFSLDNCKKAALIVAKTIAHSELDALGGLSFSQIRQWDDTDEKTCSVFRKIVAANDLQPLQYRDDFVAMHVVSAAILESIFETEGRKTNPQRLQTIFTNMISVLQCMNKANHEWTVPQRNIKQRESLASQKNVESSSEEESSYEESSQSESD